MSAPPPPPPDTGFLRSRVVQVHPTLRCNLACKHCYSSSSPTAAGELDPGALVARLARLRREGYDVASFSGGEPLIYPGFERVARSARELGYRVNVITNGLVLTARRLAALQGVVGLVGVSVDGAEARHDALRGDGSFRRLMGRLPLLREGGFTFGLAHCVTRDSIADLPWLVDLCLEQGASLLQLHPLTLTGRAAAELGGSGLTQADLARTFLTVELLQIEVGDRLAIQLDLALASHVLASRDRYGVLADRGAGVAGRPLAETVNPIVLDERGDLWPLAYGMAAEQCMTRPATGGEAGRGDWEEALDRYKAAGAGPLKRLLAAALADLEGRERGSFVDWYGHVVAASHARPVPLGAARTGLAGRAEGDAPAAATATV